MQRGTTGRILVTAAASLAACIATMLALLPSPAWARDDPPPVQGLSVPDAQELLLGWDKSVQISYEPDPEKLADGIDRSTVVVLSSDWLNPTPIDPEAPRVRLSLGAKVPDLTGLTLDAATTALTSNGLVASPNGPSPTDWVVGNQQPVAGTLLGFQSRVLVFMVAPGLLTSPEPQNPDGSTIPWWVLVAVGALLLVAAAATTVAVRRAVRRRNPPSPPERIEVRGSPGPVQGPELTESQPGASLSVRVEAHYDPGTLTMQEVSR
jgi:hypothetical protein